MAEAATLDEIYQVVSAVFDGAFYRATYPDMAAAELDLVRHYVTDGWREGRDPAPWFSTQAYLASNVDLAGLELEPLFHFLTVGRREGREAAPSTHATTWALALAGPPPSRIVAAGSAPEAQPQAEAPAPPDEAQSPAQAPPLPSEAEIAAQVAAEERSRLFTEQRDLVASEFDAQFYLGAYDDVAASGVDPLEHFLHSGWREGRDPTPRFSTRDYQDAHPDVVEADVNPYIHYLTVGRRLGYPPKQELGFRYQILREERPMAARVAHALSVAAEVKPRAASILAKAFAKSRTGFADLHVTVSHDDYVANTGGVQLCLQREGAQVAAMGRDHLHLFPPGPWPTVRPASQPSLTGVLLNGRLVGHFPPSVIAEALRSAADATTAGRRTFAIHSLLGHTADEVIDILGAVGLTAGWFWLHDFGSLCSGFHLLRNDVQDCGAPPPDSAACTVCLYGPTRGLHLTEHERLFNRLQLTVAAPSRVTLDFWRASWNHLAVGEVVLPHARLVDRGPAPLPPSDRPFRLAYIGHAADHKGWSIFRDLLLTHEGDPRYEFLHLGIQTPGGLPLSFHEVRVTDADPHRMQQVLEDLQVDAALVWPLCRETFSFTAYEAVAAGAAILTNPDSGNVQAFVQEGGRGWVLQDETALAEAMESGRVLELARARRTPRLYDLAFSALSADLIRGEAAR
jgi:hypothetical protein